MTDLVLLQKKNDERWKTAKVTGRLPVDSTAQRLFSNKARYLKIVHMLQALGSNMPDEAWVFIAATHERESGGNFNTHLGQGDPLTDRHGNPIKTVHVPAGRGAVHRARGIRERGGGRALGVRPPRGAGQQGLVDSQPAYVAGALQRSRLRKRWTYNFGASPFMYPVPSGYQAGLCQ